MRKAATIEEPQAVPPPILEIPTCQHHWLIETPRGAMSKGRCKRCGSEREFRNSANDYVWEDDSSLSYNALSGVRSITKAADDDEAAAGSRSDATALMV